MTKLTVVSSELGEALKRAERLYRQGSNEEALTACDSVIAHDPESHHAFELRSSVHKAMGDLGRAIDDAGVVIQLMPAAAAPLVRRGRYLMHAGRYEEAIADFTNAISLDAGYFGDALRLYRAEAYLRCRKYEAALEDCKAMSSDYTLPHFLGHKQRSRSGIEADARAGLGKKSHPNR